MSKFLALAGIAALTGSCATAGSETAGARTRIALRADPLAELWFLVRAQAAEEERPPIPGHADAVAAARAVQEKLGSFGGWGPLDSRVLGSADAAGLRAAFATLPDPYVWRGRELALRDDAVRLAAALEDMMPDFLAGAWPARRAALEVRVAELERDFLPRHREALAHMMRSLDIGDPGIEVPMTLVTVANPPGAMTYRLPGGAPASVVGVAAFDDAAWLHETLLHEATHALDAASREEGSVFEELRALLAERGWRPRDRLFHDLPHLLMFVQAEETMRRVYDPRHVGYGVATGLYQRAGAAAAAVRAIWPRHLDGELERREALRRIVQRAAPRPEAR